MPFRLVEEEKIEKRPKFRLVEEQEKKLPVGARLAGKLPATIFGQAVGAIPELAVTAAQAKPFIEEREQEALPEYLTTAGLEPAPEKGLLNLLALLGMQPKVQQLTPERLSERFAETTQGRFEPQTKGERILERGAQLAGSALPFGGGLTGAASFGLGGVIGQAAREQGAPEGISNLLEILASVGPAVLKGKLLPKKTEEELVNFAKKQGLSDREITSLLKGESSRDALAKLAFKGKKTERMLSQIDEKLGDSYLFLKNQAKDMPHLSGSTSIELGDKFQDILTDLKDTLKASPDKQAAISFLEDAITKLDNLGTTPAQLINFYQDINSAVNWNAIKGGKKQLASLKKPILEALYKTSPELARDFELTNNLYSRFKGLAKVLKPDLIDRIMDLGQTGEIALAIGTFNPGLLNKAFGLVGGRIIGRELLTNPKFHNFQMKMLNAIKNNETGTITKLVSEFEKLAQTIPDYQLEFAEES